MCILLEGIVLLSFNLSCKSQFHYYDEESAIGVISLLLLIFDIVIFMIIFIIITTMNILLFNIVFLLIYFLSLLHMRVSAYMSRTLYEHLMILEISLSSLL